MFWEVDVPELPDTAVLTLDHASCHVRCEGTTEAYWDDFAAEFDPLELSICDGGRPRDITQADIDEIMSD